MYLYVAVYLGVAVSLVAGHGRLIDPPSRASAWRFGFDTPNNYQDNELFCGGFSNQWALHGGKCGVCGDPWQGPREHEVGGMYATGTIVSTYHEGYTIPITVDLTANHKGWFEFRLCPVNDPNVKATQACLDQYLLHLAADGSGTRFNVNSGMKKVEMLFQLPKGLTCSQCVLQWKYNTGNSWGTDPETGMSGIGLGPQEQFYGCADIAISGDSDSGPDQTQPTQPPTQATTQAPTNAPTQPPTQAPTNAPTQAPTQAPTNAPTQAPTQAPTNAPTQAPTQAPTNAPTQAPTQAPTNAPTQAPTQAPTNAPTHAPTQAPTQAPSPGGQCYAVGAYAGNANMDSWCQINCAAGYCPASHCACADQTTPAPSPAPASAPTEGCFAVGAYSGNTSMDQWCQVNCAAGNCPASHCRCDKRKKELSLKELIERTIKMLATKQTKANGN